MSCPENTVPCGCETNPCGCKISSDDVAYQGPDLGCVGINNCDTLTTVIEAIDSFICGPNMVQTIITNIQNNTSLYNQFVTIVNQSVDCDTVFSCIASTTTTTTTVALTCTCMEIVIDQNDLDRATGNLDVDLDNTIFLTSPGSGAVLCDGGVITNSFTVEDAYKFCITASAFPLLQLYYYRDDLIVSEPDLESFLVNLSEDCSVNGDCADPTTTTTSSTTVNNCTEYILNNLDNFDTTYSYIDCDGLLVEDVFIAAFANTKICAQTGTVNFNSEILDNGVCSTTTTTSTTEEPTTTTTTTTV